MLQCGHMGFYSTTSCCVLPRGHAGDHKYGMPAAKPSELELEAADRIERLEASMREVAIPSLKYCEDKYGHDDQARLNLEACLES